MTAVPVAELSDEELERQCTVVHATRHWTFLHGTAEQFRTHTERMLVLEQEYLRRFPQRTWQGGGADAAAAGEDDADAQESARLRLLLLSLKAQVDAALVVPPAAGPAPDDDAVRALLRAVGDAGGRLHKLALHQLARSHGLTPPELATLYRSDPPLLRVERDERVLTDAGRARLSG
ncbi:MAG TPA: DUF6158 family protein [Egibacteraceae bacterium]|nr:DUF6158 family protein [Egibacteraceae bacterium]